MLISTLTYSQLSTILNFNNHVPVFFPKVVYSALDHRAGCFDDL